MRAINRRPSSSLLAVGSSMLTALAISIATVDLATAQVAATCQPSWVPTFEAQPTTNYDGVSAMVVFDDGTGPALYAGGDFTTAGTTAARFIAKWDGTGWSALGSGVNTAVNALAVFDDGSGPALYAAGAFTTAGGVAANRVAKWNGSNWSALGSGIDLGIYDLTVFDDGSGSALYACGFFATAGGTPAINIAKWNGSTWSALGSGLSGPQNQSVISMEVYDDGSGPALYACGNFTVSGAITLNHIAKWDGMNWSPLGAGLGPVSQYVFSLKVFDDGSGPALYAGGGFSTAGGIAANNVARWNGSSWSSVGGGTGGGGAGGQVQGLTVFDDGRGPALYACGYFATAGGAPANRVARWNGSSWSELGSGIAAGSMYDAQAMAGFDDGHGLELYVGGFFVSVGGSPVSNIVKWNGSTWSPLTPGLNDSVYGLAVHDDGHGPALYACGSFTLVGSVVTNKVAKWNGLSWSGLGQGLPFISQVPTLYALASFDDGTGPALYAAGQYFAFAPGNPLGKNIDKWDGSNWSALVSGTGDTVRALAVFDDGGGQALYAGGDFTDASGVIARNVGRWDGTNWSALANGMGPPNSKVFALAVFDDGNGPALYVGGSFGYGWNTSGFATASNIAKWDGSNWSGLGSGVDDRVRALAVFDDGGGPALYAGGLFAHAGGVPVQRIAKWNGSSWSSLGNGVDGDVQALAAFDDGTGPALCAGGIFSNAGTVAARFLAKWDGTSWSAMGHGMNNTVQALTTFNDSSGSALFAGGSFINAFDSGDSYVAKWGCPFVKTGTAYCTAGTTSHGCVPSMSASGSASASATSGFTISVANVEGQRAGIFFYGIHGQLASPWSPNSTSLLCVKSPLQRMSVLNSGGTAGLCDGLLSEDWNTYRAAHPTALGQTFIRGETVWAQGWFRDPPGLKTTKLSNGLVFAVAP